MNLKENIGSPFVKIYSVFWMYTVQYSAQHAIYQYTDPEFQSLNLAGQGLSGLNSGTETPASVPLPSAGFTRPKARGLVQHGGPLKESDPARCDFVRDGRSLPPALTDCTACPGLELLSCELLANLADVADVLILNVHKTPP